MKRQKIGGFSEGITQKRIKKKIDLLLEIGGPSKC